MLSEERMLEICDGVVEFDLSENFTRITIVLCGPLTAARGKLTGLFAPRSGCSTVCVAKTTRDASKIRKSAETILGQETIEKSFRTNFQVANWSPLPKGDCNLPGRVRVSEELKKLLELG